ncbi:hypothetical protein H5410_046410 [Solanum commersonii]|uniref:Reverse transcriptase n=1 Tax=Solanum commersonii TaxID=4109 RepID=A0A9J5XGE5_SOLCO|nr:hypothetical protein H5410_046410 [Solanum commersonii]
MEINARIENVTRYFRFLNCWADQTSFLDNVKGCWNRFVERDPLWIFHQKMKRVAATLISSSRMQFGDIYAKVKDYEERVKQVEENLIQQNSEENRTTLHGLNAKYIKFMKLEEAILRQKTQSQWFKEEDANSKYFHALIRGRRRRLFIHKILNDDDEWIQGDEQIAEVACEHSQDIFTGQSSIIDEEPLNCIPRMVTQAQNDELQALPTVEELKRVVFSMNSNSAAGPGGMNGCFFQKCWSIIKDDLMGLKQGDPVSPALFSLGAKRSSNQLVADDVIIFTSSKKKSLKLIMHTLGTYKRVSGQLINKIEFFFIALLRMLIN